MGVLATVSSSECLDPQREFARSAAAFVWGPELERDKTVLFRHTVPAPPAGGH